MFGRLVPKTKWYSLTPCVGEGEWRYPRMALI